MRDLIDPETGENRAVRCFLMLYGAANGAGITVGSMKEFLTQCGYPHWPEWVEQQEALHLAKGGAQDWLRHLFGLESASGVKVDASRADLERMAHAEREHDEAVREGEASEQEGYGPVALSAIKFLEQLPAEVRGKRGDSVLRGLRHLAARASAAASPRGVSGTPGETFCDQHGGLTK